MNKHGLIRPQKEAALPASAVTGFQQKLRTAIFGAVTERDIVEIVKSQVEAAKRGDRSAIRFVMDYVVGGKGPQIAIQKNITIDRRRPGRPTKARHGTAEKLDVLSRRQANGRALFHPADGEE